jgi:hypothetical protein
MLINSGGSHGAASSAHILSACLARLPPHKRRPLLSRPLGSPLQAGPTCVAASGHEDVDGRVLRQAVHPRQVAVVVADHLQGGSTRRQQVKDQRADQAGAGRQEHAITYLAALQCARQALQGKHYKASTTRQALQGKHYKASTSVTVALVHTAGTHLVLLQVPALNHLVQAAGEQVGVPRTHTQPRHLQGGEGRGAGTEFSMGREEGGQ